MAIYFCDTLRGVLIPQRGDPLKVKFKSFYNAKIIDVIESSVMLGSGEIGFPPFKGGNFNSIAGTIYSCANS